MIACKRFTPAFAEPTMGKGVDVVLCPPVHPRFYGANWEDALSLHFSPRFIPDGSGYIIAILLYFYVTEHAIQCGQSTLSFYNKKSHSIGFFLANACFPCFPEEGRIRDFQDSFKLYSSEPKLSAVTTYHKRMLLSGLYF